MLTLLLAAAALQAADLELELCNDAPFTVSFSVRHEAEPGRPTQRGWFAAEPGRCVSGYIGRTYSAEALVHARSGTWQWPDASWDGGARVCLPVATHDQMGFEPPCSDDEREARAERVRLERENGRAVLRHRVSCAGQGDEAGLCEDSPRGPDGFSEPLRILEVCNRTGGPARVAAAEPMGSGGQLSEVRDLNSGQCADIYRGFPRDGRVLHPAVAGEGALTGGRDPVVLCLPDAGEPGRELYGPAMGDTCRPGERPARFTATEFAEGVSRFTLTLGGE
jgi:hypothetical protein